MIMPSESGSQLELKILRFIAGLRIQRLAVAQLQRSDRRQPTDTETGRVTQITDLHRCAVGKHVTTIGKDKPTQRTILARTGKRELQFGIGNQARRTTHGIAILIFERTQRGRFISTHGTDTTGIEVLENRVSLATEAATIVNFTIERQRRCIAPEWLEVLVLVSRLVVLQGTKRRHFQVGTLITPLSRDQCTVAAVTLPCHGQREAGSRGGANTAIAGGRSDVTTGRASITEVTHILTIQARAGQIGFNAGIFHADAEEDAIELREWHTELDVATNGLDAIVTRCVSRVLRLAQIHVIGTADTIIGEVGIGLRHRNRTIGAAGIDFNTDRVTTTEGIFLRDRTGQAELVGLRETGTDHDVTGRLFFDLHVDIDLIGAIRHFRRFDRNFLEIAEAVNAVTRELDAFAVVPRVFKLTEFAADHFIAGLGVAGNIDVTHIHALARIDHDREGYFLLVAINVGIGIDVGKRITEVTKTFTDLLGAVGQLGAIVDITLLQLHQ